MASSQIRIEEGFCKQPKSHASHPMGPALPKYSSSEESDEPDSLLSG